MDKKPTLKRARANTICEDIVEKKKAKLINTAAPKAVEKAGKCWTSIQGLGCNKKIN